MRLRRVTMLPILLMQPHEERPRQQPGAQSGLPESSEALPAAAAEAGASFWSSRSEIKPFLKQICSLLSLLRIIYGFDALTSFKGL